MSRLKKSDWDRYLAFKAGARTSEWLQPLPRRAAALTQAHCVVVDSWPCCCAANPNPAKPEHKFVLCKESKNGQNYAIVVKLNYTTRKHTKVRITIKQKKHA